MQNYQDQRPAKTSIQNPAKQLRSWPLRTVPPELVEQYRATGYWSGTTIGQMVATGLATKGAVQFNVHSSVRPWRGTMADVDRKARTFATWLTSQGIGPGDVVVFQLPNWVEAAITFWGAAYVGAVVVPVVHFYGLKELGYIVKSVEPDVVVTADRFGKSDYLDAYSSLLGMDNIPWLVVGETPAANLPPGAIAFAESLTGAPIDRPIDADPDSPALIAFTSGTTRDPKGVIHSHHTIGFEARQLGGLNAHGLPNLTVAPVGHFIGMLGSFLSSLLRPEAPVNLIDVWDPTTVLRLMLDEQLTMNGGATFFLTSLLDHPDFTDAHLALMPSIGLGGSAVPAAVTERATNLGIKVYRSYGSTEHPSVTASLLDEPVEKRNLTDGHALPGVELKLDEEGQILTRGADLFLGYTDSSLTAKMITSDGWYITGDIGVLDDDGYLSITDRISDVIIRGGENISAQEVEELLAHMENIAEVSVVAAPDERLGEHAAAIFRVRAGASAPTLGEVRKHLGAAGLAKQKWPESLYEVTDFPRTPSGKVQKFLLRQQLRENQLTKLIET